MILKKALDLGKMLVGVQGITENLRGDVAEASVTVAGSSKAEAIEKVAEVGVIGADGIGVEATEMIIGAKQVKAEVKEIEVKAQENTKM